LVNWVRWFKCTNNDIFILYFFLCNGHFYILLRRLLFEVNISFKLKSNECVGLRNKKDTDIEKYVKGLTKFKPVLKIHVECFHFVRSGKSSRKVVTYHEAIEFKYSKVEYIGDEYINNLNKVFLDLELHKKYECGDEETLEDLNLQKTNLYTNNKHRDFHTRVYESFEIEGFANTIYFKNENANEPFGFSLKWYFIFTCFSLNYCFRRYLNHFLDHQNINLVYKLYLKGSSNEMKDFNIEDSIKMNEKSNQNMNVNKNNSDDHNQNMNINNINIYDDHSNIYNDHSNNINLHENSSNMNFNNSNDNNNNQNMNFNIFGNFSNVNYNNVNYDNISNNNYDNNFNQNNNINENGSNNQNQNTYF
jgi:hypothetical protein